uniref:CHK kinase-like domain-containing protein n=1 Tax=Graphocephala atropunctata TaxID=36148 RepID=A0A1B6KR03_9HEMI
MEGHKITLQFLQDLISQTEPDVTVLSFKVSEGAGRGDNYTSMLYRVVVSGTKAIEDGARTSEWQRSYIYKRLPDSPTHRELYRSDVLFQNEVSFYKETFASLTQFQNSTGLEEPFNAVPKCFLAEQDVIVLEDLKEKGFVMGNRKAGLDFQHCVAVFRKIARFHALSLAMKCRDPQTFQDQVAASVQETFFTAQNEEYYREYYSTLTQNALAMVDCGLEDSEKSTYLKKFEEFLDEKTFFKTMMKQVEPIEPMAVLAHGDFWTNNIMFRYSDSGDIEEVCFVDFQCVRYCSPALDLVNFLYSCTSPALRASHLQALLSEYCSALSDSLAAMGCAAGSLPYCHADNIPAIIQEELQSHSHFGLGLALDTIPVSTCDSTLAPDLYQTEADQGTASPFSQYNPECQLRMTELVRDLVDRGYL